MLIKRSGVLSDRNFLLLFGGNGISRAGAYGALICYPILALEITGSPVIAGWVNFAASVPSLLFYAHAGKVADYSDRKKTMLRCQLLSAAASAVLTGWLLARGPLVPVLLVLAPLLEGIFFAYFSLAEIAAIRDMMPTGQYAAAFSVYEAEQPITVLIGRALGSAALGLARWVPFAGNFASYLLSAASICAIRGDFSPVPMPPAERTASTWSLIRQGLPWIRRSRFIVVSTIATGAVNVLAQMTILVLIVSSRQESQPPWLLGMILAGAGVGGTLGATVAPRIMKALAPNAVFACAAWLWAASVVPIALTANPAVLAVAWGAAGATGTVVSVVNTLSRIHEVPPEALGRVVGLVALVTDGAVPAGAALGGYVLAAWGAQATARFVPLAAAVVALSASLGLRHARQAPRAEETTSGSPAQYREPGDQKMPPLEDEPGYVLRMGQTLEEIPASADHDAPGHAGDTPEPEPRTRLLSPGPRRHARAGNRWLPRTAAVIPVPAMLILG